MTNKHFYYPRARFCCGWFVCRERFCGCFVGALVFGVGVSGLVV